MIKSSNIINKDISILIVEDESVLAIGMEYSLEEMGYTVSGIESTGKNAICHASSQGPDLILMDIHLKGNQNGIEAAKHIWQYQKTPIIFLTSYCDDTTIKQAMTSEPYAYLIKPVKDEELNVAIQTAMHKHNYFYKNKETLHHQKQQQIHINEDLMFEKVKGVLYKNHKAIKLTGNEVKLLEILTDFKGETVSFERITNYIWRESLYDMGKLRNIVYRLKNKLQADVFENVYEQGYRLKIV